MLSALLSRFGGLEVLIRCFFDKFPKLKRKIKKKKKKFAKVPLDERAWQFFQQRIESIVGNNQIVLIHSSMDGISAIGVTGEDVFRFLLTLLNKGNTIVLPTFPVTNLNVTTPKSPPYDPLKTLSWTGELSNLFLGFPGVIRSVFPFNSLAAIGPKAEEMMLNNKDAIYVYGENSAWDYCVKNHAKIIFLGVPAYSANTIGIHMVPDFMKNEWPIENWYEERIYRVREKGQITEKKVIQQRSMWYKYCMEYLTSRRLCKAGDLHEEDYGCYLGYVDNAYAMVETLVMFCKTGKLMYGIPKRFYKSKEH